jgi:predicted HAD superfamily Cof-like phosphohydrolase
MTVHTHEATTVLAVTRKWFETAVPTPTCRNKLMQLGCLLEEVRELTEAFRLDLDEHLEAFCKQTSKEQDTDSIGIFTDIPEHARRVDMADALADIIVTAVGLGYMYGIDVEGALREVNRSNFSKFNHDGTPLFHNGKIAKSDNYLPPRLDAFVSQE